MTAEEIVISGMAGQFPESDNIEEFKRNLFEGVDMITGSNPRWPTDLYGLPARYGKMRDLSKFDSSFFGISDEEAHIMDPGLRMLFEATYEAIVDAGVSPQEIRGSNTGVYIGTTQLENEFYWVDKPEALYYSKGCPRYLLSNQLSYAFDFQGPSLTIDTACSSSVYALGQAVAAIKIGKCDAAIVGAVNLLVHPTTTHVFNELKVLSVDGKSRTLDEDANGYVRAESVAAIYLQKSSNSRRIYATIVGVKTNSDGYKDKDISFPSERMKILLYKEFYEECNVDPLQLDYLEIHGTGTPMGDPEEANSIGKYFCKNRKKPLLVGSIKSNMGHSEAVAGLCAIIKAIIVFESEAIPKNLHYANPNKKIPVLVEGKMKVVTETTPFESDLISINSYGLGGTNAHILLKKNFKPKYVPIKNEFSNTMPYIVGVSGRSKKAVDQLLELAEKNKDNQEFLTLLNLSHSKYTPGHQYKGFCVLDTNTNRKMSESVSGKRQIWFIISGIGNQWPGMGNALMKIGVFRSSVHKYLTFLKQHNLKGHEYLLDYNSKTTESPLSMFVATTLFQVALIDLLKHIGIQPDGIIGHSLGEICCAYADGTLTAEETILCGYYRALGEIETKLPKGAMAVIGLSAEEVRSLCPPSVFVSCDNSADNVTISGPAEEIDKLISDLDQKNIFVRKIESFDNSYHCQHVADAVSKIKNYLTKVIPNSKPRTSKWISTSLPESEWKTSRSHVSANYYANNFISPVQFRQALKFIPKDAITIEIGATSVFRAVLKRSIGPNSVNISLVKKNHSNNIEFFLSAIGDIYNAGAEVHFDALYPKVKFPVSIGTPMISSYVKWDHSSTWKIPKYEIESTFNAIVEIDMSNNSDEYISGHVVEGKIVFPGTGFLQMAWEVFAKLKKKDYDKTSIVIEDFEAIKATVLSKTSKVKYLVNICEEAQRFYVSESGSIVAKGKIREMNSSDTFVKIEDMNKNVKKEENRILLTQEDVYQTLVLAGYDYGGLFKSVMENDLNNFCGKVRWDNNYAAYIDGLLQLLLSKSERELRLLLSVEKIIIDPEKHLEFIDNLLEDGGVPAYIDSGRQLVLAGGVQLTKASVIIPPKRKQGTDCLTLEKYQFVPYDNSELLSFDEDLCDKNTLKVMLQIVIENCQTFDIEVLELILDDCAEPKILEDVLSMIQKEPRLSVIPTIAAQNLETKWTSSDIYKHVQINPSLEKMEESAHFVLINNGIDINQTILLDNIKNTIKPGGFLLLVEANSTKPTKNILNLQLIATQRTHFKTYRLFRNVDKKRNNYILIEITNNNFDWISKLKTAMNQSKLENRKILLYACGTKPNGFMGLVNTLRLEPGGKSIRSIFINDKNVTTFDLNAYENQLHKDLVHNVYKKEIWGSYRHTLLEYKDENHKVPASQVYLDILVPGDFSTLTWIEASPYLEIRDINENHPCDVYYGSLNFKDVILATGKMNTDTKTKNESVMYYLGNEFSGKLKNGRRVMGIAKHSFSRTVVTLPVALWDVPDEWSLEEAATVPVAYVTNYYGLILKGKLKRNESILIHSGAGAVGLAAIAIALDLNCEIFTTVSSDVKKQFLLERFPKLKEANIGYSRDSTFKDLVLARTNGKGVNVVLNSLSGVLLQTSIKCLCKNGRFIEIGKADFFNNSSLPMKYFTKNISFYTIYINYKINFNPPEYDEVHRLITEGIKSGVVKPLPATVFSEDKVENAFRILASGTTVGKILVRMRDDDKNVKLLPAISQSYMNPQNSFIIVGGLGGFGLELTNWLIEQGARKVVLTSRNGIVSGYQKLCIDKWQKANVDVKICTLDVTTEDGAQGLIESASTIGKIDGIFNLAVVLNDAVFENQTIETFRETCKSKIDITKQLDKISRKTIPDLKYFVVFSSYACGRGNPGQSNYALANSAMEKMCEDRRECGYHGLAIQWGAIDDVGIVAKRSDKEKLLEHITAQRISSCLSLMNQFLKEKESVVCSMITSNKPSSKQNKSIDLLSAVANILGITNTSSVSNLLSFSQLGLNSLMASEVKMLLEESYNIQISTDEIRNLSFKRLTDMLHF